MRRGRLIGIGVGPGDPELITVKALRMLRAAPVVAYLVARGQRGNAFAIIETHLRPGQQIVPLVFPVTTEQVPDYEEIIAAFYGECAATLGMYLDDGLDVAVICEGDPFFYGSFMYLHDRLAGSYVTEVVPGVCAVVACAAVLGTPVAYRNQSLAVLSAMMPETELAARLALADAAAIMKLGGNNFAKVRRVLTQLGLAGRALYIERATMANERAVPLRDVDPGAVPYFSMILVPGQKWQG
jgi:precorrin-2/cobalt-factor-2 C20-methyltransferase